MRSLQRYFSVLLVFVLLFGVFSISVYADESDKDYVVKYAALSSYRRNEVSINEGSNGVYVSGALQLPSGSSNILWTHQLYLTVKGGSTLLVANRKHNITINNLDFNFLYTNSSTGQTKGFYPDSNVNVVQLVAVYTDGSTGAITDRFEYRYNARTELFSLTSSFIPTKDVYQLIFQFSTEHNLSSWGSVPISMSYSFGVPSNEILVLDVTVKSEETEQLEGILGRLTELFQTVKNGFTNIVDGVVQLPGKLWALFEEGIKGLFVPSQDDMLAYKDKWEQLLSNRLGAVYQVIDKLLNSWDTVMSASQNGTIQFPQVAVILAGVPFSFGGWTVSVIPQRFQFFTYPVKSIVGIVCTISFVNGLRKRYDEVMGVEK